MFDVDTARFARWVLGLSVPFYVVGTLASGDEVEALPVTTVVAIVPAVAATIVTRRNRRSVRELLASSLRAPRRQRARWMVTSVVAMPMLLVATHVAFVSRDPEPGGVGPIAIADVVAFELVGSFGEEIGWTAFATRRELRDHSVLLTAFLIAGLWSAWHLIPFVHTNNSLSWVAWQTAFTAVFRVLITVCVVASGGSVLVAVLLHASYNVAWSLLATTWSAYDPAAMTLTTAAVAAVAVVLVRRRSGSRRDAPQLADIPT